MSVVKSIFLVIVWTAFSRFSSQASGCDDEREQPEAIISIRDLTVGFGDVTILKGLSLDVFRGEILGVVGGSGAGKTVLMRTIIGLLPRRGGSIEIFGTDQRQGERSRSSAPFSAAGASFSSKARCSPR